MNKEVFMMKKTKWMALSAMFVAITVVFSQISFPIPGTPIVFTMGIMAVMLTGCMLPKGYAFLALLVYLLLGVCGLPVFSSFGSGLGTLLGYTGGFLMTYPIMAFLTAWLWELWRPVARKEKKHVLTGLLLSEPVLTFVAVWICLFVCYAGGALWYMFVAKVDFGTAMMATVIPFIPMDTCKAVLSTMLVLALRRALHSAKLLPAV